jgi:hypothetical protein
LAPSTITGAFASGKKRPQNGLSMQRLCRTHGLEGFEGLPGRFFFAVKTRFFRLFAKMLQKAKPPGTVLP